MVLKTVLCPVSHLTRISVASSGDEGVMMVLSSLDSFVVQSKSRGTRIKWHNITSNYLSLREFTGGIVPRSRSSAGWNSNVSSPPALTFSAPSSPQFPTLRFKCPLSKQSL